MIRASEAYDDNGTLQTVIDGKRNLGYISIFKKPIIDSNGDVIGYISSSITEDYFFDKIKENNLKTIKVKEGTYIFYVQSGENDAKELLEIAKKYGGYLDYRAIESDTRRIGELLGYNKDDIDNFINKKLK